jgi:ketosteroid isomerase-like protein
MKTGTIFVLTFFASSLFVFAQGGDPTNEVLQTERELCTAYLKSDSGAIAQGVMEDYTLTNSTGKITTRANDIEEAKKNDPKYEVFENYDMKVRVHGDTAIVTGRTHTTGISSGKPFDSEFQFTDTFVKNSGRWRLLAGHVSKVPTKKSKPR